MFKLRVEVGILSQVKFRVKYKFKSQIIISPRIIFIIEGYTVKSQIYYLNGVGCGGGGTRGTLPRA